MAFEFRFPDVGEGIHEGRIVEWLVAEGEEVRVDQPFVKVETDKAVVGGGGAPRPPGPPPAGGGAGGRAEQAFDGDRNAEVGGNGIQRMTGALEGAAAPHRYGGKARMIEPASPVLRARPGVQQRHAGEVDRPLLQPPRRGNRDGDDGHEGSYHQARLPADSRHGDDSVKS
jgi:hypothetical protein